MLSQMLPFFFSPQLILYKMSDSAHWCIIFTVVCKLYITLSVKSGWCMFCSIAFINIFIFKSWQRREINIFLWSDLKTASSFSDSLSGIFNGKIWQHFYTANVFSFNRGEIKQMLGWVFFFFFCHFSWISPLIIGKWTFVEAVWNNQSKIYFLS